MLLSQRRGARLAGLMCWALMPSAVVVTTVGATGPMTVTAAPTEPATVELNGAAPVVTVQPVEPRYAPPASLKQFRYAKPPVTAPAPEPVVTVLPENPIVTVKPDAESPRYARPKSLETWGSGRKVPLYAEPDVAPWQASPSEPRLKNAAVSCNYKDEGGVRGRVMLVVNGNKVSRFQARIEMPNGGVCQFDARKMRQTRLNQGLALESPGDDCVVRMWEQDHRITVAAYSCHRQCSKGSFSYLWPILIDTRVGTCY